jgi:DNA-3-methyladenine glycosylase I
VDGRPKQNRWKTLTQLPVTTKESDALSKDLKQRGSGASASSAAP